MSAESGGASAGLPPPAAGSAAAAAGSGGSGQAGVLLYYAYRDLRRCQAEVRDWMEALCCELGLVGRVRVALDGLNATLGGSMAALRQHIAAVEQRFGGPAAGPPIDFKLAASSGRKSEAAAAGSKFDRLTVATCKEVVSTGQLGWLAEADASSAACTGSNGDADLALTAQGVLPAGARHVEPAEFHAMLAEAAAGAGQGGGKPTVMIDARNYYETRIGRFQAARVELLDPEVRCFSDTPAWLEANQHRLANRRIMMYCTGGVRCERASAFVRSLGSCFQDVVQLKGGIQRYLEAFPDGGFFKGKNFVFDERMDVEGGSGAVVGTCIACGRPWDDYRHRRRCACCRMLVLMCDDCAAAIPEPGPSQSHGDADAAQGCRPQQQRQQQQPPPQQQQQPICDLCQRRQQQVKLGSGSGSPGRRLRILCLHGFRQSARNFEGRTHALRRRLKDLAEFVFVDAPHHLPAWSKADAGGEALPEAMASAPGTAAASAGPAAAPELAAALAAAQQQWRQEPRSLAAERYAELAAPMQQEVLEEAAGQPKPNQQWQPQEPAEQQVQRQPGWLPRRAWLLVPEQYAAIHSTQQQAEGQVGEQQPQCSSASPAAPAVCLDEWQFQRQTAGWRESVQALEAALQEQGPFDGVMGFSQGAAVAAVLAAQAAVEQQHQQQEGPSESGCTSGTAGALPLRQSPFRFAILCSGYVSPVPEHGQMLRAAASSGGAALPTLHIFGSGGDDRQVSVNESAELAECFDPSQRFVVRHSSGHIIPSSKAVVHRIRDFLLHVQQQERQQMEQI